MLPIFPYSRQPDVRYVRPDTPLVNAPAMLFKDSIAVSSGPTSPNSLSQQNPDMGWPSYPKYGVTENNAASAHIADRSTALGGSGSSSRISYLLCLTQCREWD